MAKKKRDEYDDYAEEFGEDELETLYELLEDFPELEEYLDDILEYDDADFYSTGGDA
jgi:hypothetical protein